MPSFPHFELAPRPGTLSLGRQASLLPRGLPLPSALPWGRPGWRIRRQATRDCPPVGGQAGLGGGNQNTSGSNSLPLGSTLAPSSHQHHLPDTLAPRILACPRPGQHTAGKWLLQDRGRLAWRSSGRWLGDCSLAGEPRTVLGSHRPAMWPQRFPGPAQPLQRPAHSVESVVGVRCGPRGFGPERQAVKAQGSQDCLLGCWPGQ